MIQPAFTDDVNTEFRPVESIMRCDDFKSNFARRLSTRYTSKSPIRDTKKEVDLIKLDKHNEEIQKVNETKITISQTKVITSKNNELIVQPSDTCKTKNDEIRCTEVTALKMEVETLRWQLTQTEANRQMHLALLKQIVSFLNRVKDHMVCQTLDSRNDGAQNRKVLGTELPRSRSVLHVSKNADYSTITPSKKMGSKKISKSISNVNGLKDNTSWKGSKLSIAEEKKDNKIITEELSRLITLATSVISTKLPELVTNLNDDKKTDKPIDIISLKQVNSNSGSEIYFNDIDVKSDVGLSTCSDDSNIYAEINDSGNIYECVKEIDISTHEKTQVDGKIIDVSISEVKQCFNISNFHEAESGFSSMNSFQEIGIPIINIIPPTPCKDINYVNKEKNLSQGNSVQVFWV